MKKRRIRQSTLLLLFLLSCTSASFAQPKPKDIEQYLEQVRKDWNVPGMAVAIVKDGKVFSNKGYGYLEAGDTELVDENTLFAIASNTKAFVSSALGVLQQEGKLDLNDKVQTYLPEFMLYDAYASSEATLTDLLCHRLGLGTYSGDVIWYKTDFSASEVIDKIKFVPQKYSFRGGFGYSNLMFITAGDVIKTVSGKAWDQFINERFFTPLQMDRTITSVAKLQAMGNYAVPHKPALNKNLPIEWVNWDNMGAAGGIISSSSDMSKWLLLQLNNGIWEGDTIIMPAIQNTLWSIHNSQKISLKRKAQNPGTNFVGYGLGWGVSDYFGYRMVTHGGGYDGMYSQVAMIPELELGIVILTNTMKGIATPIRFHIINSFIGKENRDWSAEALVRIKSGNNRVALEKERIANARVDGTKPTHPVQNYLGSYNTDMLGKILILESDGQLYMKFQHSEQLSAKLEHWHYDTWQIKWENTHAWFDFGTIQFALDEELNVSGFSFNVPNYDIFFHELKVTKSY